MNRKIDDILAENKALKKENESLKRQLKRFKPLFDAMGVYVRAQGKFLETFTELSENRIN